ncbi:UNVERIFIED_CONTAM: hypothetical protein NCL1_40374 [Trichonephila clavipes]
METTQKELEVLLSELSSLKKNAKVYKQLQNSNVCFLSDIGTLKQETQKKLDDLKIKKEDEKPS